MKTLPDSIHKFRLAVLCPNASDGTSLVRGVGPLAAMARQDRRLELDFCPTGPDGAPEFSWDWLVRCDALFVQRPQASLHISAAVMARSFNRPVWVDWDDDLTCVPDHNPYRRLYEPAAMRDLMGRMAHLADVVTVTTEALRGRVEECAAQTRNISPEMKRALEGRVRVLPNGCQWKFNEGPRQRRVVWRGGKSHDADVMEFLPAIASLARLPQFSLWKWCFMGELGPLVASALRQAVPESNLELGYGDFVHQYMAAYGHLGPWVNIVPLQDIPFNRAKSNLAWIEATCAGALTLAPDWLEWRQPGVAHYEGVTGFEQQLRKMLEFHSDKSDSFQSLMVQYSREHIRQHLMLDTLNAERWALVREELCAGLPVESVVAA